MITNDDNRTNRARECFRKLPREFQDAVIELLKTMVQEQESEQPGQSAATEADD